MDGLAANACPVCGAHGVAVGAHQRWHRYHCSTCALEFWSPRQLDPAFYAHAQHDTYARRHLGERFLRDRHRIFLSRALPGDLLDVGCGEGAFLVEAMSRGFRGHGIELDARSAEVARERGVTVDTGALMNEAGLPPAALGPFDVVTAVEVLEHQAAPMAFLAAARSVLRPGGQLCGSVPNRDRCLATWARRRDGGDLLPHHFLWFSQAALRETLHRAGFCDITILPIVEADTLQLAGDLENALLGGVTARWKTRARTAASSPTQARRGLAARALGWAKLAKNVPLVPAALFIRHVVPDAARSLYFEARSSFV